MRTTLATFAAVAGLFALIAVQNAAYQTATARADDEPDAATKIKQLEDKAGALEASQQKLVKQLHDLEFPELRHRDADEIRVLKLKVQATKTELDRIVKFREAKVIGGEEVLLGGAAFQHSSARAELAWAEGNIKDAVRQTAAATVYAQARVRAYLAIRDGPPRIGQAISVPDFYNAIEARARARMAMLRALAVAKTTTTDVSDIKTEVIAIRTGATEVKPLTDVLKFLREPAPDEAQSVTKEQH